MPAPADAVGVGRLLNSGLRARYQRACWLLLRASTSASGELRDEIHRFFWAHRSDKEGKLVDLQHHVAVALLESEMNEADKILEELGNDLLAKFGLNESQVQDDGGHS